MSKLKYIFTLMALMLGFAGCDLVHEFPYATADNPEEIGIDPSEIETKFNVEFTIDFEISTVIKTKAPDFDEKYSEYDRRFIIEIYNNDIDDNSLAESHVIYRDANDESNLNVDASLHAKKYKLVVWMDYVEKDSHLDLYYTTANSLAAIHALPASKYVACTDFKDAQYFVEEIDLTEYADVWFAEITIKADLVRPVAKITFVSTDLEEYAKRLATDESNDLTGLADNLNVHFSYNGYFPTGFNAFTGRLNDSEVGFGFNSKPVYPFEIEQETNTYMAHDYVFVNGDESSVTVSALVTDQNGDFVNEVGGIVVPIKRGAETIVYYNFLTHDYMPGIGINPEFDGEFNIYVQ